MCSVRVCTLSVTHDMVLPSKLRGMGRYAVCCVHLFSRLLDDPCRCRLRKEPQAAARLLLGGCQVCCCSARHFVPSVPPSFFF